MKYRINGRQVTNWPSSVSARMSSRPLTDVGVDKSEIDDIMGRNRRGFFKRLFGGVDG